MYMIERLFFARRHRSVSFSRSDMLSSQTTVDNKKIPKEEWTLKIENELTPKHDLDELVLDFLNTEGHKEAAEQFKKDTQLTGK